MIKFFRRIRQNLLSKGKNGEYLKYAVGEIILVVVGILIALWINNTYNTYKESNVEKTILNKLMADIESDFKLIKGVENFYLDHLKALKRVEKALFSNQNDSIEYLISKGYGGGALIQDINPRTTTYDEMINSGKLYSLSNNYLTNLCIDYYEALDKNTYEDRQSRIEFRNLAFGPQMIEFWLLFQEIRKDKDKATELIKLFVKNKNSITYKTLKQTSGWSVMIIEDKIKALSKIKHLNREVFKVLKSEIKEKDKTV